MPWQARWRIVGAIKPDRVYVVESRADGSKAVLKTSRECEIDIAREIAALERMNATGASVPMIIEHNLATFRTPGAVLFVVMEYIKGATLWEYAKTNTVTSDLITQIADVVNSAHSIGLTHGDLSPNNILIKSDGTPVVVDWGCGLLLEANGTPFPPTDEHGWAEAVKRDLLSLEKLPMTLDNAFVAKRA